MVLFTRECTHGTVLREKYQPYYIDGKVIKVPTIKIMLLDCSVCGICTALCGDSSCRLDYLKSGIASQVPKTVIDGALPVSHLLLGRVTKGSLVSSPHSPYWDILTTLPEGIKWLKSLHPLFFGGPDS